MPPHPVRFKGNRLARWLLDVAGWQLCFDGLPSKQGVIVVYPHTSNWDFVVGILAKWAWGLPIQFWGKDSLFNIPILGWWIRWVGGIAVVRSAANGMVDSAVGQFKKAQEEGRFMWVALAPEGTRRKALGWRSGFYQIVLSADVPLGLAHLDFSTKTVRLVAFISVSGDRAVDFERLAAAYRDTVGFHPTNASPIVPLPPRVSKAPSSHE